MNNRLSKLLQNWELNDHLSKSSPVIDSTTIRYLGETVFNDYEPSQFDQFEDRLDRWLHNVDDDASRRILFQLLNHLVFIGRAEFESLCRAAYHGQVLRWIVDELGLDITDSNATSQLSEGIRHTWFGSITDSMRINSFFKANRLNQAHRPDWQSLKTFADPEKIRSYIDKKQIDRLVLLEDFVGSGTQMAAIVRFAATLSADLQILVLPLVSCPHGNQVGRKLEGRFRNLSYESVMTISQSALILPDPQADEPPFYETVRDLIATIKHRLNCSSKRPPENRCHGFKGTGAVVAMYSNCPNNTLPMIYEQTSQWNALFPRITRY